MDGALILYFDADFERWRTFRQPRASQKASAKLLDSVLDANPQINEFDSALWRVLRGLANGRGVTVDRELEILSALGSRCINAGLVSDEYASSKSFPHGLEPTIYSTRLVAQMSHRYWVLHDSQDQVKESGVSAARKKIASKGGVARRENLKPLREKIERLAYKGLTKSTRKRYGSWERYEDMEYDLFGMLKAVEQKKVKPSTVLGWVKKKYPEFTTQRIKNKK